MWIIAAAAKLLQLCPTLCDPTAPQAPPSLGFSRQEHWSGLPFLSPMRESEVTQLCPSLQNLMNCSPPGSSIHGIFQAKVLEWGAIAYSGRRELPTPVFWPGESMDGGPWWAAVHVVLKSRTRLSLPLMPQHAV